jgi:glycosyltransferase involved in cell wall biosynthesis
MPPVADDVTPMAPGPETTSIVIPAFNEAASIGVVVRDLRAGGRLARGHRRGRRLGRRYRGRRRRPAGARVVRHPYNKGNGAAVKTGIRHATGAFVLIADADGQHQPSDAARLVSHLEAYDLVGRCALAGHTGDQRAPIRQRRAERHGELPHRTAHPGFDLGIPRRPPRVPARVPASAPERLLHAHDHDARLHEGRLQRPLRAGRCRQRQGRSNIRLGPDGVGSS